ncbi:hypothetical protein CEK25_009148 [Fusarium fujikuroi]|nr:hypothetical protein CEK25_009148 [Fusarium fujikuroi]
MDSGPISFQSEASPSSEPETHEEQPKRPTTDQDAAECREARLKKTNGGQDSPDHNTEETQEDPYGFESTYNPAEDAGAYGLPKAVPPVEGDKMQELAAGLHSTANLEVENLVASRPGRDLMMGIEPGTGETVLMFRMMGSKTNQINW